MTLTWFTTRRLVLIAVAAVLCSPLMAVALVVYVAQPVRNEGTAMLPSIRDGDRLMINKWTRTYQRGDVVVFYYPRNVAKSYIKRIVAVAGESVEIHGGEVFVDGVLQNEP